MCCIIECYNIEGVYFHLQRYGPPSATRRITMKCGINHIEVMIILISANIFYSIYKLLYICGVCVITYIYLQIDCTSINTSGIIFKFRISRIEIVIVLVPTILHVLCQPLMICTMYHLQRYSSSIIRNIMMKFIINHMEVVIVFMSKTVVLLVRTCKSTYTLLTDRQHLHLKLHSSQTSHSSQMQIILLKSTSLHPRESCCQSFEIPNYRIEWCENLLLL